ncbi:hypothetical protein NKH77_23330 [Streptomyces sp. M19]
MSRRHEPQTVERGGFRISVPDSWWEFDVRPESRDDTIRQMVNERVRAVPELGPHRDVMTDFLRRSAREAWESGAVYCGCMAENFGGDVPITASVTVSIVGARTSDGTVLPTDPTAIVGSLRQKTARREGDPWRSTSTVDIPEVGLAARTQGIEDIEIPGDRRTVRTVLMQTFIPVPNEVGKVALVAGSSQVLDLADSFFDIFDAVTSTFRFV